MKRITDAQLDSGDLYLFTPASNVPSGSGLWGIFDRINESGEICLEVDSPDFEHFQRDTTLSQEYVYCRQATRHELRDFAFNMGSKKI